VGVWVYGRIVERLRRDPFIHTPTLPYTHTKSVRVSSSLWCKRRNNLIENTTPARFLPHALGYLSYVSGEELGQLNTGNHRARLLLVDDELDLLCTLSEILQELGYAVVATWEGEEAVEIASVYEPAVLITDFRLPGIDGVTTIQKVRKECPNTRTILMSGYVSVTTRQRAEQEHVDRIMQKPVAISELLMELRRAAARAGTRDDAPEPADLPVT
jgi:CheY-like chemotaxis protein